MKKFLSLVLALVMTMSLVTISAGAKDFTDAASIDYKEAVDVMSALKIVDGTTDGAFNPDGALTRGAAAKIICNLVLGPTTASALKADAAPFVDVPASHTFAGYIAYCVQQGILDGYNDGTFRPSNPLTGYAFMKMLLGALGYDKDIEGFNGGNWSVNVAKLAIAIGLDDGNDDFNGVATVTRQEALLYAFNTLQADCVKYGNRTTVNVGGAEVVVGAGEATKETLDDSKDYRESVRDSKDDGDTLQFCEKYFKNLKKNDKTGKADAFGRPATTWYLKNDKIGTYAKEADLTYYANVAGKTIYADLDLDKADAYNFDVVIDGDDTIDPLYVEKSIKTKLASAATKPVGNGSKIEVFEDEQRITVVNEYLMQVAGDYNEKKETLTLINVDKVSMPALNNYTLESEDFAGLDKFADEDYVIVTVAKGTTNYDIKSIKAAEKVTATVTEYVDAESVTAGGTTYKYSAASAVLNDEDAIDNFQYTLKTEYDLYLDSQGNVMLAKGVEAEDKVVFINEFAASSNLTTNAKVVAHAYFLDGTKDEIIISKLDSNKVNAGTLTGEAKNTLDSKTEGWYKFVEKDGKYELKTLEEGATNKDYTFVARALDADDVVVVDYEENHTYIEDGSNSYKGNAATKFIVVKPNGDVVTYTGIKNMPKITAAGSSWISVIYTGNYAKYVFIDLADGSSIKGSATSTDLIYIRDLEATYGHDVDGDTYYRYAAIKNGEDVDVFADSALPLTEGMLYTNIGYNNNDKKYINAADPVEDPDIAGDLNPAADEDIFTVNAFTTNTTRKTVVTLKKQTINFYNNSDALEESFYMADGATVYVCDTDAADQTVDAYAPSQFVVNFDDAYSKDITVFGVMNADGEYTALYVVGSL